MKLSDTPDRVRKRRYEVKRIAQFNANARFIAVDSEGGSAGDAYWRDEKKYQPHKTFLWGASDFKGDVQWLFERKPLSSEKILNWLLDLGQSNAKAIFISFAFGYDVTQALADLPYEKAWEIQHGKRYSEKDNPNEKANTRRITYWRGFGLQYLKGKQFSIWSLNNNAKPRKDRRIRIYDVFGFFQASFLKAIKSFPDVASAEEYAIVEKGKAERGEFYISNIEGIKEYTKYELIILCRMMTKLRSALQGQNLNLTHWYGAGSIAQALMKREQIRIALGERKATQIDEYQAWAHYAFFGGRTELVQQGNTHKTLYGYDIASAYPAAAVALSSMQDGHWIKREEYNCQMNSLSLIKLRAKFSDDMPLYPLPYRTPKGSILFPREVYGIYNVVEVIQAMEYAKRYGGVVAVEECWEFIPSNADRPFAFLSEMFRYRTTLSKDDITQIVIKLGINSVYGKLAQAVGQFGKPPVFASPWHAAAITAWTRARLMQVVMADLDAVVMLATDGIVSTEPLPIAVPIAKTLGEWEAAILSKGGVFVQSGVYAYADEKGGWKVKSRGFRPSNIDGSIADVLREEIPEKWNNNASAFSFPYQNYMTLGASCVSRETWECVGQWVTGERNLDLTGAGVKRDVSDSVRLRRARARKLIATRPSCANELLCDDNGDMLLSSPSVPEWLDADFGFRNRDEDEQEQIIAGMT